jgi:hypothetical protein
LITLFRHQLSNAHVHSVQMRCSGERPICKRCSRLRHTCSYNSNKPTSRKSPHVTNSPSTNGNPSSPPRIEKARHNTSNKTTSIGHHPLSTTALTESPRLEYDLGIPKSLVSTLVEVYYENVYNARLLLHKGQFLESLAAGTANPHVVLSVCASAAKYFS